MPILVQCGACAAKYNLADTLAGKKIRCKKCGGVIAVPAPAARRPEPQRLPDEPDLSSLGEDDDEAPAPAPVRAPAKTAPRRPSVLPPPSRMPTDVIIEGPDDDDDDSPVIRKIAANPGFAFPGSKLLDTAAPYVLAVIAIGWMFIQTLSAESAGAAWVPHLRWALYLAAYVAIVYPLSLMGVRIASQQARFGLPPAHAMRVFGIFSLPFMLGIILALIGGTKMNYVIGEVVGLLVALAFFAFLYRLRPHQVGPASAIAGGFFALGVVIVSLLALGLNTVTLASMRKQQTVNDLNQSPFGPAFEWDPAAPHEVQKPKPKPVLIVDSGTDTGTTQPATTQSTTQPTDVATSQPTTKPEVVAIVPANPGDATPEKMAGDPSTKPATTMPDKPATMPSASPLVASISTDNPVGEFDDLYVPNFAGGNMVLIVKSRGQTSDAVELWNTQPYEKKSTFVVAHPVDEHPIYWVGPKALSYARLTDFPRKGTLEIHSTTDDKLLSKVELNTEKLGTPTIIGFGFNNQILILWQLNAEAGIQCLDTNNGQQRSVINLPGFQKGRENVSISPDGKLVAAGVKVVPPIVGRQPVLAPDAPPLPAPLPAPAIQITDISPALRPKRIIPINFLTAADQPNFGAITFSTDSAKLSLLYVLRGSFLIQTFKLPEIKPSSESTLFSVRAADAAEYQGQVLDNLPGSTDWLLYGSAIADGNQLVGDLGIPGIRSHRIVDHETIAVVIPTDGGKAKIVTVKLNPDKIGKPAAPK